MRNQGDRPRHVVVVSAAIEAITRAVPGADGAMIRVEEFAEPYGKPLLVHPGSPASRRLFRPGGELAEREFGPRLLS